MRTIGVCVRGIRTPIIKAGDDLVEIVVDSLQKAWESGGFSLQDQDVIGITESVVARSQNNYASIPQIAAHVRALTGGGHVGLIFPILSRNRFSILLKAIAQSAEKLTLQLSFPADEVGNHLVTWDQLDEKGVNPYADVLTEKDFRRLFGEKVLHPFTGIDYVDYYKSLSDRGNIEIIFSNNPEAILRYTGTVITADIHSRHRTKRLLKAAGAKTVIGLDDILTESINGSGYNSRYGLLGSNKATEDSVKLFPENAQEVAEAVQARLKALTGKSVEVMVYGDGAFKDPVGKIWELADPVVSPGFTSGLRGTPNELKMKYLADTEFKDLCGEAAREAMVQAIKSKNHDLVGNMAAQGTTPRQLTDLLGSLCDLTSGSGDKGTPVILIQGYFDNYAS
ncbi:MAG: coenzyme F420-0:L-glutamate ligase [Peptococcaceae bacterium]|nr:coenzyme F420-0:L-glutamate ligase [Peptococcaceae bacterium]